MSDDAIEISPIEPREMVKIYLPIPYPCMGVFLRHKVKMFDYPDGLYRTLESSIIRYSEHFGIDNEEIREVIIRRSHPSQRILDHLGLELQPQLCDIDTICTELHYHFVYDKP